MKLKLTKELFKKGVSSRGACSKAQFEVLGVSWPLENGWYPKLIGREFDVATLEKFLALKDKHLKGRKALESKYKAPTANPDEPLYRDPCPTDETLRECPFEVSRDYIDRLNAMGSADIDDFWRATDGL